MERHRKVLKIKESALEEPHNFVYIGDLDEKQRCDLLIKIFENSPIVDDSIPKYEILYSITKQLIEYDEIGYWFGRRLDISLKGEYILSNVFDSYTEKGMIQKLVTEVRS